MKATNSEQPLVSVIMPTYNYAQFIGDAIRSVLDQTYKNLELIIIDNYSEDNTEDIIASFSDSRIKYKKFRNNGIIAVSRNVGIRESHGKYIAFLDSDDMWKHTKIEKQVAYLEKNQNVQVVYTHVETFGPQGKKHIRDKPHSSVYDLLFHNTVRTSSTMVRKMPDIVFSEDPLLFTVEDYALWVKLYQGGYKFHQLPDILTKIRNWPDSISRSNESIQVFKKMKVFVDYCIEYKKDGLMLFIKFMMLRYGYELLKKKIKKFL